MGLDQNDIVFSNDEEVDLELIENQPLRVSGLVSLGIGLLSPIAFTAPYMWSVPVFAIVLGVVALRPAKGLYVGKTAASIGICLALFFGSWAVVRHNVLHNMRMQTVSKFAIDWLDSFKYPVVEFSFEMTQPYGLRQYKTIDLQEYYKVKEVKDAKFTEEEMQDNATLSEFKNDQIIQQLQAAGTAPKWKLREITRNYKSYTLRNVTMVFEDTTNTIQPVRLSMQRVQMTDELPAYWHVESYEYEPIVL